MDVVDMHIEAWEGIRNGFESGRLAHAYVIVGSPRGNALQFAESFLKLLFCESAEKPCNECKGCRQVDAHKHVDTLWIEPQSKSRMIRVEDVEALIRRISQTSFGGGWKAGIILQADRMNNQSENKLLKTLEEPPKNTILLLVTDSPQGLLPTIISRCQKIVLSDGRVGMLNEVWQAPLMHVLSSMPPTGGLDAARLASQMKGILDTVKEGISATVIEELDQNDEALDESKLKVILEARTNARLKEVQADIFRVMLEWQRDVLMLVSGIDADQLISSKDRTLLEEQAKLHTQASALNAIQEIEAMAQRLDRNIPAMQIFDEGFRKMARKG
jgi:DNA polymerase-3 subunit delta'